MGVRDLTTIALKSVVIVNTDAVDNASQLVANRYCAMYGIPLSNQFPYAMGTAVEWAYSAGRFAGFWTDLYAKVQAVGAYAVFTTPGCPVGMTLQDIGETTTGPANFSLLVGFVKRIYALGHAPYALMDGAVAHPSSDGSFALYDSVANHKGNPTVGYDRTAIQAALQVGTDADYVAAGGTNSNDFWFTTYRESWSGDYSTVDNLLTGHIGYFTHSAASHPASLFDLSRPILGKSGNLQSDPTGRVALVCPWRIGGNDYSHDSKQALIGKKLVDLGLDVKCWYYTGSPSAVATALLPATATWTTGELDAGTATPDYTPQYCIGSGFDNWKCGSTLSTHDWTTTIHPHTDGGIFSGGASYGDDWGQQFHTTAGHTYIAHMSSYADGYHQVGKTQSKHVDVWLALIAGRTMAEAAWCGLEYSFLACGDPLARPFA